MATIHEIKERPIQFSAPMVRAILAGTKTQTRRAVHNPHRNDGGFVLQDYGNGWWPYRSHDGESGHYLDRQKDGDYYSEAPLRCPYGRPGDRLWVRETWYCDDYRVQRGPYLKPDDMDLDEARNDGTLIYRASSGDRPYEAEQPVWRPSLHMPRWASRITLEVTGVRVERLQDINREDAIAEGVRPLSGSNGPNYWTVATDFGSVNAPTAQHCYELLWNLINGPGSWEANPWVWVVAFERIDAAMKGE